MPAVVHLVPRPQANEPTALARDLASTPWSERDTIVRVIELFDPRGLAAAVDLSLAERDVPEIAAVLHDAAELHLHGIHPRVALRCLPDVKHAVLAGIAVVVHGPVAPVRASSSETAGQWPGPVRADAAAAPDVAVGEPFAPTHLFVDVDAPDLLPRACGAVPLILDDGGRLAVICLAESVGDGRREQLRIELESLTRPEVRVEVYDEGEVPSGDRASRRRAASAVVVARNSGEPWPRSFVEAMLQGLPLVVLGEAGDDAPIGVMFTGARDQTDRALACVRSWVASWAVGQAPTVDQLARARWVAARRPG